MTNERPSTVFSFIAALSLLLAAGRVDAGVALRNRTVTSAAAAIELPPGDPATMIVVSEGRITKDWRRRLGTGGARIVSYLPGNAFLVRVPREQASALAAVSGTRFTAPYLPVDKLSPALAAQVEARGDRRVPVHILIAPDTPAEEVAMNVRALGLTVAGFADGGSFNDVTAFLPAGRLDLAVAVADLGPVLWIEPRRRRVLLNDTSIWVGQGGLDGQNSTPIFDQGIYGVGQTVAVLDTGLDYDMCYFSNPSGPPPVEACCGGTSFDASLRKVVAYDMLWANDDPANPADYDNHSHGTHVAGSVAGDDFFSILGHDRGDGMAPGAKLVIQDGGFASGDDCADLPGLGCPVVDLTPIFDQSYQQGARFHSNSWGDRENFVPQNTYTAACVDTDEFMWTHPDFLIIYAAGNAGPGNDTVGSPSTAKNTVSVGATQRGSGADSLAGFSSRGYAEDGRQKPTVTAPGVGIVSASTDADINTGNCGTQTSSGTSMACPTVAGLAALVGEYYTEGFYPSGKRTPGDAFTPSAALIKATLVNSGEQMLAESPIPSRDQGWGRVTLDNTLSFPGSEPDLFIVDEKAGFATGATTPVNIEVDVRGSGIPLEATLVWTDAPSNPAAAINLVNDLDLRVSGPSGDFLGNVFSNGESVPGGSPDTLNVEEGVLIAAPGPGIYTITIAPGNIPTGPQPWALVVTGDLPTPLFLAYQSFTIAADENTNGWADPGERVRLAFTIRNRSDVIATAVTGRLESLSPLMTITDADGAWSDVAVGGAETSTANDFEILLDPSVICGSSLPLRLTTTSAGKSFTADMEIVVGGLAVVTVENFDTTLDGDIPAGWTVSSSRPNSGMSYADATVEPVGSPGPPSPPNALFVGRIGNGQSLTSTDVMKNFDLSAYTGTQVILSFSWWTYEAENSERLVASLSDQGPPIFAWDLLRTSSPYDSATDGGNLWGRETVDLSSLAGFNIGADVWLKFATRLNESEAAGDAFYVDDIEIQAPFCEALGACTDIVADAALTDVTPVCPNTSVVLDGSDSRSVGACNTLEYEWYDGPTLVGTGAQAAVFLPDTTSYRLAVTCVDPPSCTASTTVTVPVLAATSSTVDFNSLRAARRLGAVELLWTGSGGDFNVGATLTRSALPTLWTGVPLNPTPIGLTNYTDTPAWQPLIYYQVYGTNDCNGRSVP